jgi:hypothetical protein
LLEQVVYRRQRHHRLADAALTAANPVDAPRTIAGGTRYRGLFADRDADVFVHCQYLLRPLCCHLVPYRALAFQMSLVSSFGTNEDCRAPPSSGRAIAFAVVVVVAA